MMIINDIKINCDNKYTLAATIFAPTEHIKGAVMIAAATGIKRRFYQSFATFLAENGYDTITFDYQGIGDSKEGALKNCQASLVSWGQSDLSFVFATLKKQFPNVKYHLVGHSAGGQLVGLMQGATELTSIFNFACSSGSMTNLEFPFKFSAHFFLNCFIPLNNLIFGFTNAQWLAMGEPLPRTVAQQWANWCNATGYVKDYLDKNVITHFYNELACPSLWVNAVDDKIANNDNTEDMLRVFPNLKANRLTLEPSKFALNDIGHMKFFTKQHKILWQIALDWLD